MPVTYRNGKRVEDGPAGSTPPPMRPSGMGESGPRTRNGNGGGKGGGMAENQSQITKSMNDKKWGYYDPYTGKQVPWYIDMINGGGKNSAGEDFSGGVGTIGLGGALANILGINPYGQDRDRTHSEANYWKGGDLNPSLLYQFGRSAGGGGAGGGVNNVIRPRLRPSEEERLMNLPVQAMSADERLMGLPVEANPLYAQAAAEAGMGLDPFGGSMSLKENAEAGMGLSPFGGSLTPMEMSAINRNYRIKGTNDPVGETTAEIDGAMALYDRYLGVPPWKDPRHDAEAKLLYSYLGPDSKVEDYDYKYLMPPNQEQIRQTEEARNMSLVDAMRRGNYTQPYANMGMGEAGRTSPVMADQAPYTGSASGLAQQNLNNQEAMRQNMSNYTAQDWENYTRAERRDRGLPVSPLDKWFAGSDAFAQPPAPPSMVNQDMMLGVLKRAGFDTDALGVLGPQYIEDMYNKYLQNIRARGRG